MAKKNWIVPELLVLVRSDPQEAVLVACKTYFAPAGPNNGLGSCATFTPESCPLCDGIVTS